MIDFRVARAARLLSLSARSRILGRAQSIVRMALKEVTVALPNSKAPPVKAPSGAKAPPDIKVLKKKNLMSAKLALRIAAVKTKSGSLRWVSFAFTPGKA